MTDWRDYPEDDVADPQDGGEPIKYWWAEDMRPEEVCELVKRAYERGVEYGAGGARKKLIDALLDCYARAEDVDEHLQEFSPELERVVNNEVQSALNKAMRASYHIQNIVRNALGGSDALVRAQYEYYTQEAEGREREDEKGQLEVAEAEVVLRARR